MVSLIRTSAKHELPQNNEFVAQRLEEIADLFEARDPNPWRARAYRNAARTVRALDRPVAEFAGEESLTDLPGIGKAIALTIERLVFTGDDPLLGRLRGRSQAGAVLATVPGIGRKTAARIRAELKIESLADLELAAYDGRLEHFPGIGQKRLRGVRDSLAGRFRNYPRPPVDDHQTAIWQPPVVELLSIDDEYRRKDAQKRLVQVSPLRFNPSGAFWLPVLRTRRSGRRYTAMYSNTARAHEAGQTHDWVVIFKAGGRGQWTVVTSRNGTTQGLRVVRGREAECDAHYAQLADERRNQGVLFGTDPAEATPTAPIQAG